MEESKIIIESPEYTKAVLLHRKIMANAQAAQESLYEVCRGLKEMRDGKLYKELGYKNFEDYCENEVGLSRHMAYKYITIADIKNVESIQQIGVTKLALLAKLDEPVRQQIQENTDLENTTVKELKEKIFALETENKTLSVKLDETNQASVRAAKQREELIQELDKSQTDLTEALFKSSDMERKNSKLEERIRELEERPVEVAVEKDTAEINRLNDLLSSERISHSYEIEQVKSEYQRKLNEVQKPEKITDNTAVFKVYLNAAAESAEKLMEFVQDNPEPLYRNKALEFFNYVLKNMED